MVCWGSKVGTLSPCWNLLTWVGLGTWDPMWIGPSKEASRQKDTHVRSNIWGLDLFPFGLLVLNIYYFGQCQVPCGNSFLHVHVGIANFFEKLRSLQIGCFFLSNKKRLFWNCTSLWAVRFQQFIVVKETCPCKKWYKSMYNIILSWWFTQGWTFCWKLKWLTWVTMK